MLVNDAFGSKETWHMEFLSIITSNVFKHCVKLVLDHGYERN
jgi:hypothetical protein